MTGTPIVKIDAEERTKRLDAVSFARGSLRYEGIIFSPEVEAINMQFVNGELTLAQYVETAISHIKNNEMPNGADAMSGIRIAELQLNPVGTRHNVPVSNSDENIKALEADDAFAVKYLKSVLERLDDPENRTAEILALRKSPWIYECLVEITKEAEVGYKALDHSKQDVLAKTDIVKPLDKTQSGVTLDEWTEISMKNMVRMTTDENYRKEVAKKLS